MHLPDPPFVLLDDAREGGGARLYADPVEIVSGDVPAGLKRLRQAQVEGLHAAGWLNYEGDRLWFGLFRDFRALAAAEVTALLPDPAGAWAASPEPRISRADYAEAFTQVADYIAAGDIYQANLTFRAEVRYLGGEAALYALLRQRAGAGYGALIATGADWVLSFSPELFFSLDDGTLTARPMKGTAVRGADPVEDAALAAALARDDKQRAENLMIVDLMRNDLARVSRPGSVAVPELFRVERYPTVHQMVSDVTAELAADLDPIDALQALFPCGSVTGAPKIRAMQIIDQVEADARGIYTGAIGRLDADGNAMFNVAIRTLAQIAPGRAVLGLGSGVVADSNLEQEWQECLAKGAFVTAGEQGFDLIETMRFDPVEGIALLERHLARMKASALAFGFEFDRHAARNDLQAATFRLREACRVRLLLAPSGVVSIGVAPLPDAPSVPVGVAVVPLPVAADDFRLRHKTSRRRFYDRAREEAGAWEVVFTDQQGFLTEGSFTTLYVERDGMLVTPPLARGLLPGVLRAELIESGRAVEGDLTPADLAGGFYLGNALRGLVAAVTFAPVATAPL
jgi:para-aminobenzoate synthetase / 4-amino-4-deoxychorismate lyase